jgi:protein SCO1
MARNATIGFVVLAGAVLAAAAFGGRYFASLHEDPTSSKPAPEGRLLDLAAVERSGRTMRTAELAGRCVVADFVFTSCSNQCPRLQAKMRELQESAPELQLVSFTVDPDRDTAERLAKWATALKADSARWLFLRASVEDLRKLMVGELHLSAAKDPTLHSDAFALFGPDGRVRGIYRPLEEPEWRSRLDTDLAACRPAAH